MTCSKACRQRKHRFRVGPAGSPVDRPMTFCYADPPYPGLAQRYYGCDEVDHRELVRRLVDEFPDGWALSTSAAALPAVLRIVCEVMGFEMNRYTATEIRVASWVKGARRGLAHRARSAWEPVIVVGGRPLELGPLDRLDDALVISGRQRTHPNALIGMKPAAFAEWVFRMLGARQGDQLVDLFPGSGSVSRAWDLFVDPSRVDDDTSRLAGATRHLEEVTSGED